MGYKFALFATDACIFYERTTAHLSDMPLLKKIQVFLKTYGMIQ